MAVVQDGGSDERPFGARRPGWFFELLIHWAQEAPRNRFGRFYAKRVRRQVFRRCALPIDVNVGTIQMRCHFIDNSSERRFVFTPWRYDVAERAFIANHLPPDGVFLDIGANVGVYSLWAASFMNRAGRVLAIEPNPNTYRRLAFNLASNRTDESPRMDSLELGVSEREGDFLLSINSANLGASTILALASGDTAVKIHCFPLLTILAQHGVDRIDILKIDIEGAEDQALCPFLHSAPAEMLPRCLLLENSEELWTRDLRGDLRRRGYTLKERSRRNSVYQLDE